MVGEVGDSAAFYIGGVCAPVPGRYCVSSVSWAGGHGRAHVTAGRKYRMKCVLISNVRRTSLTR